MGGSDGLVEVLEVKEKSLKRVYALENSLGETVKCIILRNNSILLGDDQANIKNIYWKESE